MVFYLIHRCVKENQVWHEEENTGSSRAGREEIQFNPPNKRDSPPHGFATSRMPGRCWVPVYLPWSSSEGVGNVILLTSTWEIIAERERSFRPPLTFLSLNAHTSFTTKKKKTLAAWNDHLKSFFVATSSRSLPSWPPWSCYSGRARRKCFFADRRRLAAYRGKWGRERRYWLIKVRAAEDTQTMLL